MLNRLIILSLFLCALAAHGQESRGTILGHISDPSGASVSGAKVEAVNIDTRVVLRTLSNEAGNYQIPFVVPGNYKIRALCDGFKAVERDNVRISTGTFATLDFQLELGNNTESITVKATTPLLNPANADLGQVISTNQLNNVTVALSRNALYAAQLAPGVNSISGTVTGNSSGSYRISGGGGIDGGVEYLIDGIPDTVSQNSGGTVYIPSVDAVDELKVQTTMFDAAYGHSNAGVINITTKGGSNQVHGSVYLVKQWAALNANSWSNNRTGLTKSGTPYHQYGYLFSGPVFIPRIYDGRNRTFFSTTFENDNDPRSWTAYARVPTDAERLGDFSQTLSIAGAALSIYNPFSTVVSSSTKATRTPFPSAVIPASLQTTTGKAWMKLFPEPTLSGAARISTYNWATGANYYVKQRELSFRVDHYVSDRQRIFARYGDLSRDQNVNTMIPGQISIPPNGTSSIEYLKRGFTNFGLDDTYTFSPTLIASLRYGFTRKSQQDIKGALGYSTDGLGLSSDILSNQAANGWPTFTLNESIPTLGSQLAYISDYQHSLMAQFTKLHGNHSMRFGIDYRMQRYNTVSPGSAASGSFTFSPTFTLSDPYTASTSNTSGTAMASLLLGLPASGSIGYSSPLGFQNHYVAGYFQEDWKVSTRLTLNLGLRWELETPWTERYNRMEYEFDYSAALPVTVPGLNLKGGVRFAGVDGNPRAGGPFDTNNFGPRFGFAYLLTSKTVLRGGYGLFYSPESFNTSYMGDVGVYNTTTSFVGTTDNGATPYATLASPFPTGVKKAQGSSAGLMAQAGDTLSFLDPRRVSPYNQQWQFGVQRELPAHVLFETAYVGMLSVKQFQSFNVNELPDSYLAFGSAKNAKVTNPFLGVFPATSTLGQGSTIAQSYLWTQYPQFTTLTVQGANTGRTTYHALQTKVDKRLTKGLTVMFAHAWSKLMDNETTSIVNPRHYHTVSSDDIPQLVRLAVTYEFPWRFGKNAGWNRLVDKVAGGWSMSAFYSYASGGPLGVSGTNGRPIRLRNPSKSGSIEDRLGDRTDSQGNVLNPYFDTTAFQLLPTQYMVSPEPPQYGDLRAPPSKGLNASLFKAFPIRERLRLQLRMEATGVTNTPSFSSPGVNSANPTTFGVITSASGARAMQGSVRLTF